MCTSKMIELYVHCDVKRMIKYKNELKDECRTCLLLVLVFDVITDNVTSLRHMQNVLPGLHLLFAISVQ